MVNTRILQVKVGEGLQKIKIPLYLLAKRQYNKNH